MPGRLEKPEPTRRDFIGLAGLWASGLAIFGSLLGVLRLPKPNVTPEVSNRIKIGKPAEFPPGTTKILPEYKLKLISTEAGIAAISLVCTHLGCIVNEITEGFSCPCHGSKFNIEGEVLAGPAPRALPWHEISLAVDGSLIVDTGREVKANSFFSA